MYLCSSTSTFDLIPLSHQNDYDFINCPKKPFLNHYFFLHWKDSEKCIISYSFLVMIQFLKYLKFFREHFSWKQGLDISYIWNQSFFFLRWKSFIREGLIVEVSDHNGKTIAKKYFCIFHWVKCLLNVINLQYLEIFFRWYKKKILTY